MDINCLPCQFRVSLMFKTQPHVHDKRRRTQKKEFQSINFFEHLATIVSSSCDSSNNASEAINSIKVFSQIQFLAFSLRFSKTEK